MEILDERDKMKTTVGHIDTGNNILASEAINVGGSELQDVSLTLINRAGQDEFSGRRDVTFEGEYLFAITNQTAIPRFNVRATDVKVNVMLDEEIIDDESYNVGFLGPKQSDIIEAEFEITETFDNATSAGTFYETLKSAVCDDQKAPTSSEMTISSVIYSNIVESEVNVEVMSSECEKII